MISFTLFVLTASTGRTTTFPDHPLSPSGSDYSPTPADDDASDQDFIPDSGEEDFTCKKRKEVGPPPLAMLPTAESAIEGAVFEPDLSILH